MAYGTKELPMLYQKVDSLAEIVLQYDRVLNLLYGKQKGYFCFYTSHSGIIRNILAVPQNNCKKWDLRWSIASPHSHVQAPPNRKSDISQHRAFGPSASVNYCWLLHHWCLNYIIIPAWVPLRWRLLDHIINKYPSRSQDLAQDTTQRGHVRT